MRSYTRRSRHRSCSENEAFMQFTDVIKKRRAIRDYTDKPVERTTIEKLIGSAILAPSAMNLQPWAFAAVVDRQKVDEYAKRAKEWLLTSLSTTSYDPSVRHMLEDPNFTVFHHAPALVLILAKSSASQASEDCCLAAENFMLAAREEGLGTCWVGFGRPWLDLPSTKTAFGLPDQYHVVAPIVLGYPETWPESPGRSPAEIHWLG
jgi:nitroreductase